MNIKHRKTDWTSYYEKPYKTASFSRKITERKLIGLLQKYLTSTYKDIKIIELGGGNSCFFETIQEKIGPQYYKIIDNSSTGIEKFKERYGDYVSVGSECADLLQKNQVNEQFDLCFSVGLIEHFSVIETANIIETHFSYINPKGICIITFPTPTFLYKITRRIAEWMGLWIFWDERPLSFNEVETEVKKYGEILHSSITWPIFLTQGVIVIRKS